MFPLYRTWQLFAVSWRDTIRLVCDKNTAVSILESLCDLYSQHEDLWRVKKVWLDDYVIYTRSLSDDDFTSLSEQLNSAIVPERSLFQIGGYTLGDLDALLTDEFSDEMIK